MIKFPFKEVYSTNTVQYEVHTSWTINQMIEYLTPKIVVDFNINQEDIELIPNNQYEDCVPMEILRSLNDLQYGERTIAEQYGLDTLVAFYIRRRNHVYERSPLISECVVCLNDRMTSNTFGCRHQLCNRCASSCRRVGHNRCPVCRQNLIGETM